MTMSIACNDCPRPPIGAGFFVAPSPRRAQGEAAMAARPDVMWSGLRLVENQFGEAGFAPR
jgi:hypothetical protein